MTKCLGRSASLLSLTKGNTMIWDQARRALANKEQVEVKTRYGAKWKKIKLDRTTEMISYEDGTNSIHGDLHGKPREFRLKPQEELTLAQVCAELGRDVKIVKG